MDWWMDDHALIIDYVTNVISTNGSTTIPQQWYTIQILHTKTVFTYIHSHSSDMFWLVVSTPLKNMSSSVGMMKFPTEWTFNSMVPVTTNQIINLRRTPRIPTSFGTVSSTVRVSRCGPCSSAPVAARPWRNRWWRWWSSRPPRSSKSSVVSFGSMSLGWNCS